MQTYKLVMLETPFVNGYAELETETDRLVNAAINEWDEKGYDLTTVEMVDRTENGKPSGVYTLALHFVTKP